MLRRASGPWFLVGVLLICLASGGVGYAAGGLPKNSVGAKQIKKGAVTAAKLAPGSVSGVTVADGSIGAADLAPGVVPAPPTIGPDSITGAQVDESTLVLPRQPGSAAVSGAAFRPTSSGTGWDTGSSRCLTTSTAAFYSAELPVPPGATVTSLRVAVIDSGAGSLVTYPTRVDVLTGQTAQGEGAVSTGSSGRQVLSVPLPSRTSGSEALTVDVFVPVGSSYALCGAVVTWN